MRRKTAAIIFVIFFLAGLVLLLYPTFSNWWNMTHATHAVTSYRKVADELSETQYQDLFAKAENFNAVLAGREQTYSLTEEETAKYKTLLDPEGTGIMGYIEIPSIKVELPIYHGTDEAVLQTSIGHLEWTSLPVGGTDTHCVLSGHRGLPSARLFTDIDKMTVGDTFTITVLNRTITYEVYSTETVEPEQISSLGIRRGEDLCTLVTCTPYGINTHRLLVHARRIENTTEAATITSEATQVEPVMVMPFVAFPLLALAFAVLKWLDKLFNGMRE